MSNISNCNFTGVHWDTKALESVEITARALLNLTELFKSQNIQVTCIKIEADPVLTVKPEKNARKSKHS